MNSELKIGERPIQAGLVWDLEGDLTKQAEETLLQSLAGVRDVAKGRALALNFAKVAYINSSGIALLIRLAQTGIKSEISLYAFGINAHYQKMFRLIGLTDFIMIYPDEYSLMLQFESST